MDEGGVLAALADLGPAEQIQVARRAVAVQWLAEMFPGAPAETLGRLARAVAGDDAQFAWLRAQGATEHGAALGE